MAGVLAGSARGTGILGWLEKWEVRARGRKDPTDSAAGLGLVLDTPHLPEPPVVPLLTSRMWLS